MARPRYKLNALQVSKLTVPGLYGDGAGLWFQVSKTGGRSWIFRFERDGRVRSMGLGAAADVSLAEAREAADAARRQLRNGLDPIEARTSARAERRVELARGITFRDAGERFVAAHSPGWRNEKHGAQWTSTLERFAYPAMGDLPVAVVDTAIVMKALEPIWTRKPETANRVRARIERVLDWAKAREFRTGENPARWRGHLDQLLPAPRRVRGVVHHPAMPFDDLPAFMARLRETDGVSADALEFTILTAARTGETIGAAWDEIDQAKGIWTVPGDRTKSGRPHRVPLVERALEILAALPRERGNPFVFVGSLPRRGLSNMSMLQLLRGMTDGAYTVHGFRSTFRDWAGERTAYPREVAEAALAHVVADKTEAAYRRGDALDRRRLLMRDWAAFCQVGSKPGGTVVSLRGRGAAR